MAWPEDPRCPPRPPERSLEQRVGELVGEASMCWHPHPSTEVFDSTRANRITRDLVELVGAEAQRIDELRAVQGTLREPPRGFEAVRLETASGAYVTTERMPCFAPPPRVVMWGVRTFVLVGFDTPSAAAPRVYREAFAYAIPTMPATQGGGDAESSKRP